MRRLGVPVAVIALLAAGVFAAVSIASGGGLGKFTTTGLTTTTAGKVLLCHRTHSAKHPFVTIRVAVPAVRAHLRHGDVLGPCTAATVASMKKHGNKHTTTTTTTTTTAASTPTTSHGKSGQPHGNSGNHGGGKH
jgi:hypothetical protein